MEIWKKALQGVKRGVIPPSPPPDLDTLVYSGNSFSVSGGSTTPVDMFLSADGMKLFVLSATLERISSYELTVAWDITTAQTGTRVDLLITINFGGSYNAMNISPDGTIIFLATRVIINAQIFRYVLSTPYDLSTAVWDNAPYQQALEEQVNALALTDSGSKLFIGGMDSDTLWEHDLSTPYKPSPGSYNGVNFSLVGIETYTTGMFIDSTGTRVYTSGQDNGGDLYQFNLSTPFDLSTASHTFSEPVNTQDIRPQGVFISPSGHKLYTAGQATNIIYEYDLG